MMHKQFQGAQDVERVRNAFASLTFPITKQALISSLGDETVEIAGTQAALADLLRGIPLARFRDADHATRAMDARVAGIARWLEAVAQAERGLK